MRRNLDITALRALLAVADAGSITLGARQLNLMQTTVSMQLKRLEASVGSVLLERSRRGVRLTPKGEQVLAYARRIVALNDEALTRITGGPDELRFGVPHDIVYAQVPRILRRFARFRDSVKVKVQVGPTRMLRAMLESGELDLTLAAECGVDAGGRTAAREPLGWIGAVDGVAWRTRPLPLAFEHHSLFRDRAIAALDRADIDWEVMVDADSLHAVEGSVAADQAVTVFLAAAVPEQMVVISHDGALPTLPECLVNLYVANGPRHALAEDLAGEVLQAYA